MCCSFSIIQGARVEISTDASNFTPQSIHSFMQYFCVRSPMLRVYHTQKMPTKPILHFHLFALEREICRIHKYLPMLRNTAQKLKLCEEVNVIHRQSLWFLTLQ
jgi:hypothetical protein